MMTLKKEQVDNLENKLITEKAQIEAELEGLKDKLDFSNDALHLEEEADETEETANYLGVKDVLDKRLRKIEKALDKIQSGKYGQCENCNEEIDIEVLEKEADSAFCRSCKIHLNK